MPPETAAYHVIDGHVFLRKFAGTCLAAAARGGRSLALIALRVDGFETLREASGEQAAQAAVGKVYELLKANTRSSDLGGRLDGGDLLVVAPGTGPTTAWLMAERIRAAVERAQFESDANLTVSIGVAEYAPGDGLGMLVCRAREAVAAAARAGGNQVRVQSAMAVETAVN